MPRSRFEALTQSHPHSRASGGFDKLSTVASPGDTDAKLVAILSRWIQLARGVLLARSVLRRRVTRATLPAQGVLMLATGLITVAVLTASSAPANRSQLLQAVAGCDVPATAKLLAAGADPNASSPGQAPIIRFLASTRRGCADADALAVTQLLEAHGARFDLPPGRPAGPSLLVGLASRHLPQTLAYVATRPGSGEPTEALRAIARQDDVDSVKALLAAGAEPIGGQGAVALLEAARAGPAASVTEMLRRTRDLQAPSVLAALAAARTRGDPAVIAAFTERGVVAPPAPEPRRPVCDRRDPTAAELALLTRLGIGVEAQRCRIAQTCGTTLLVDCNAAADGPAYYVATHPEQVLSTCGGACMGGRCTNCPPATWTCDCRL